MNPRAYNYLQSVVHDKNVLLSRHPDFYIHEAGRQYDHLASLSAKAGWNQSEEDLSSLVDLAGRINFLATIHGGDQAVILGSGMAVRIDEQIRWISMVLVYPEVRRQGIAAALMKRCLADIRLITGEPIIGLDATLEGKMLYRKMGFIDSFDIYRSFVSTDILYRNNFSGDIKETVSIDAIKNYLAPRNCLVREPVISTLSELSKNTSRIAVEGKKVKGFIMSRPGMNYPFIGPLFADDEPTAEALTISALSYWKKKNYNQVLMDLSSAHFRECEIYENKDMDNGNKLNIVHRFLKDIKPVRSFTRMYHLISSKNYISILENLEKEGDHKTNNKTKMMLDRSVEAYDKTFDYMEWEEEKLATIQYATGGPEFS